MDHASFLGQGFWKCQMEISVYLWAMLGAHLPFCQLKLLNRLLKKLVNKYYTRYVSWWTCSYAHIYVDLQFSSYKIMLCQGFGFILCARISGNNNLGTTNRVFLSWVDVISILWTSIVIFFSSNSRSKFVLLYCIS